MGSSWLQALAWSEADDIPDVAAQPIRTSTTVRPHRRDGRAPPPDAVQPSRKTESTRRQGAPDGTADRRVDPGSGRGRGGGMAGAAQQREHAVAVVRPSPRRPHRPAPRAGTDAAAAPSEAPPPPPEEPPVTQTITRAPETVTQTRRRHRLRPARRPRHRRRRQRRRRLRRSRRRRRRRRRGSSRRCPTRPSRVCRSFRDPIQPPPLPRPRLPA